MEGIRQQEIFPLLHEGSHARSTPPRGVHAIHLHHPEIGPALDPGQPEMRRLLDFLMASDHCATRYSVLEPLELWGVNRPRGSAPGGPCPGLQYAWTRRAVIGRYIESMALTLRGGPTSRAPRLGARMRRCAS